MDRLLSVEAFVRVAETGNFAKAAQQLGVTRSVITHRIQQLEQFINAPLFAGLARGDGDSHKLIHVQIFLAGIFQNFQLLVVEVLPVRGCAQISNRFAHVFGLVTFNLKSDVKASNLDVCYQV